MATALDALLETVSVVCQDCSGEPGRIVTRPGAIYGDRGVCCWRCGLPAEAISEPPGTVVIEIEIDRFETVGELLESCTNAG